MTTELLNIEMTNIENKDIQEVKKRGRPRKYEGENPKERMYESIKNYNENNADKVKQIKHNYYVKQNGSNIDNLKYKLNALSLENLYELLLKLNLVLSGNLSIVNHEITLNLKE